MSLASTKLRLLEDVQKHWNM